MVLTAVDPSRAARKRTGASASRAPPAHKARSGASPLIGPPSRGWRARSAPSGSPPPPSRSAVDAEPARRPIIGHAVAARHSTRAPPGPRHRRSRSAPRRHRAIDQAQRPPRRRSPRVRRMAVANRRGDRAERRPPADRAAPLSPAAARRRQVALFAHIIGDHASRSSRRADIRPPAACGRRKCASRARWAARSTCPARSVRPSKLEVGVQIWRGHCRRRPAGERHPRLAVETGRTPR